MRVSACPMVGAMISSGSGNAHPAAVGATQIVGRAALDSGAFAGIEEIAAHVGPGREERVLAGRVLGGVPEQAEERRMRDDEASVAHLPFRAAAGGPNRTAC